ncbi:potassium-transporting ATPase subunit C [Candidatus Nitrosocosmicus arcticus]|uniref:K+-transporting ATPase, c chain n=1 Tax=Candidatus Nitrosocosmicus arcticus TaxID=2035267 RepID=A0A557SWI0_9ARCH|nr:potassium-transporting ATPase subunit C [Candidatus Nitrosocosmicus arcticus]TVP40967.1 K+-transporting ATPase, c chain [Candidatus Nitrosocosmicus arcticus]
MNNENKNADKNGKSIAGIVLGNITTAIRILVVMVIALGIAYPIILAEIAQITVPFQSGGSILEFNGEKMGSKLISQQFESPNFFHPRPSSDSASTVDPHITPENAYSQIKDVSDATGIHQNTLRTLLNLNIEQNKLTNALFFAPQYVNVLEVNIELVNQYPEVYNMSVASNPN